MTKWTRCFWFCFIIESNAYSVCEYDIGLYNQEWDYRFNCSTNHEWLIVARLHSIIDRILPNKSPITIYSPLLRASKLKSSAFCYQTLNELFHTYRPWKEKKKHVIETLLFSNRVDLRSSGNVLFASQMTKIRVKMFFTLNKYSSCFIVVSDFWSLYCSTRCQWTIE